MTRQSWVQDPVTGKLIPKELYVRRSNDTAPAVLDDIQPFVSPITKRVVSSRSGLRQHNREHGVTDSRDYSADYLQRRSDARVARMQGRTPEARQERRELIMRELDKHGR